MCVEMKDDFELTLFPRLPESYPGYTTKKGGSSMIRTKVYLPIMIVGVLLLSILTACEGQAADKEGQRSITMKMAVWAPESDPHGQAAIKFKELVENKTNGKVKVQLHPNSSLGDDKQTAEAAKLGTIEISLTGTGSLSRLGVGKIQAFNMPFLFKDNNHVEKVFNGPTGLAVNKEIREAMGLEVLSWWSAAPRTITNNKRPINSVKDVKGLNIRVAGVPVYVEMIKALGAQPVEVSFSELYQALQTKVADGQDNPAAIVYANRYYEIQKYLAVTNHAQVIFAVLVNGKFWDGLPQENKNIIRDAAMESQRFAHNALDQSGKDIMKKLEEKGMAITYPDQKEFAEATKDIYKKFTNVNGFEELYNSLLLTR